jgi:HSP20 family molecular chaperone IbpA
MDVVDMDVACVVTAVVPGVKKEEVQVEIEGCREVRRRRVDAHATEIPGGSG